VRKMAIVPHILENRGAVIYPLNNRVASNKIRQGVITVTKRTSGLSYCTRCESEMVPSRSAMTKKGVDIES